jgi:hypothetical protein
MMKKEENEIKWIRKRRFWSDMQKFLIGFRIISAKTEITGELGAPPMLQRQAAAYHSTGRRIIRITLTGYQRESKRVRLEPTKEGVEYEGTQVPPRQNDSRPDRKAKKK